MTRSPEVKVQVTDLLAVTRQLFSAVGLSDDAAADVAEALVQADQENQSSHGVMMAELYVRRILDGSVSTRDAGEVVSDRGATAVIDAHDAVGQLTARQAMDLACDRAAKYGLGAVAVRNAFHFGTANRYTELAAQSGKIGVAMSNTRPLMPAPGGSERLVGNNPIAIAIPTSSGSPISFDMATSQAAMGKIRLAAAAGERIPVDWATNSDGLPTTDPGEAIAGMLLPFGGPKGFGLALMVDLLSGLLSGGGWGSAVTPLFGDTSVAYNSSQLFLAIDPSFFGPVEAFTSQAEQAAERIRQSARADPAGEATLTPRAPGDARRTARARNRQTVPVAAAVLAKLIEVASRNGVDCGPLESHLQVAT